MSQLCETHQKVFYAVCGFFIFSMSIMISYVVINNNRAIAAEQVISADLAVTKLLSQKEHAEMMDKVTTRMNDGFQEIRQRLARIEAKLN
jgi:hypothetical protein